MKDTFYFSHDYGARNDEKIIKLISAVGYEGYGLYWAIVEMLYENEGFLEYNLDTLAFALRTDRDRIAKLFDGELFVVSKGKFYSKSVNARLIKRKGKSEMARQSAFLRWNKPKKEDANAMRTQCDGNAIKESKVKESKVKELADKSADNQLITEVINLFKSVNPMINFGNKTYRQSVLDLLKETGNPEQVLAIVNYAIQVQGEKYAPTITNPYQLKIKFGELKVFANKKKSSTTIAV